AREIEKSDLELLGRDDALSHEVYAALLRQGRRKVEDVRKEALRRKGHAEPVVRAGAAEALGFFGDSESFAVVRALLDDPDASVRVRALEGMGNLEDPSRAVWVLEYLRRPGVGTEEKVSAYSSLLRLGVDEKARAE